VLKRYVDIGDHVKAGQLLAEITAPGALLSPSEGCCRFHAQFETLVHLNRRHRTD
jgi:predicted deacylase